MREPVGKDGTGAASAGGIAWGLLLAATFASMPFVDSMSTPATILFGMLYSVVLLVTPILMIVSMFRKEEDRRIAQDLMKSGTSQVLKAVRSVPRSGVGQTDNAAGTTDRHVLARAA